MVTFALTGLVVVVVLAHRLLSDMHIAIYSTVLPFHANV